MFKEFIKDFQKLFEKKVAEKPSWGCNQVKELFSQVLTESILNKLEEQNGDSKLSRY